MLWRSPPSPATRRCRCSSATPTSASPIWPRGSASGCGINPSVWLQSMPTILRFRGLRVMIYSYDHRPPHVHVIGPGAEARIALGEEGERDWGVTKDGLAGRGVGRALGGVEG